MYKDLDEAEQARIELVSKIQDIDTQLSHKAAENKVGRQANSTYKAYLEWKASASYARKELNKKLQLTKLYIKNEVSKNKTSPESDKLLTEIFVLVKDLIANGAELTREEKTLVMNTEAFLESRQEKSDGKTQKSKR